MSSASLPAGLQSELANGCDLEDIAGSVFSSATWDRLTDAERARLSEFLPPTQDAADLSQLLETEVFSGAPRFHGAPLKRFWTALQNGEMSEEAVIADAAREEAHARAFEQHQRQHHNAAVHKLLFLRRTWKPPAPKPPRLAAGGAGGGSGDQLIYSKQSGGLVRRAKAGGVGVPLGRPYLGEVRGGASGGGGATEGGAKGKKRGATDASGGAALAGASPPTGGPDAPGGKKARRVSPPSAGAAEAATNYGAPAELRFFELVRDAIASVPQALAPAEYVGKQVAIQAQAAGMIGRLPRGTILAQYVRSVLAFMCTPAAAHAARTQRHTDAPGAAEPPPPALIAFESATQSYRWIGPAEASANHALRRLEALHYELFLAQHGGVVGAGGERGLHAPPKAQKSVLTLPPGSAEQLAKFREEEAARFANPEVPFIYTLRDGSRAAVAPLGKKTGGKAREHFILAPDRPTSVTLLALVRDAAARLPGGEGSRTDVCELLKESAFLVDGVNDAQISTVASGALDRLERGVADPCVKFDSERKLWMYTHGKRTAAQFAATDAAPAESSSSTPQPS